MLSKKLTEHPITPSPVLQIRVCFLVLQLNHYVPSKDVDALGYTLSSPMINKTNDKMPLHFHQGRNPTGELQVHLHISFDWDIQDNFTSSIWMASSFFQIFNLLAPGYLTQAVCHYLNRRFTHHFLFSIASWTLYPARFMQLDNRSKNWC